MPGGEPRQIASSRSLTGAEAEAKEAREERGRDCERELDRERVREREQERQEQQQAGPCHRSPRNSRQPLFVCDSESSEDEPDYANDVRQENEDEGDENENESDGESENVVEEDQRGRGEHRSPSSASVSVSSSVSSDGDPEEEEDPDEQEENNNERSHDHRAQAALRQLLELARMVGVAYWAGDEDEDTELMDEDPDNSDIDADRAVSSLDDPCAGVGGRGGASAFRDTRRLLPTDLAAELRRGGAGPAGNTYARLREGQQCPAGLRQRLGFQHRRNPLSAESCSSSSSSSILHSSCVSSGSSTSNNMENNDDDINNLDGNIIINSSSSSNSSPSSSASSIFPTATVLASLSGSPHTPYSPSEPESVSGTTTASSQSGDTRDADMGGASGDASVASGSSNVHHSPAKGGVKGGARADGDHEESPHDASVPGSRLGTGAWGPTDLRSGYLPSVLHSVTGFDSRVFAGQFSPGVGDCFVAAAQDGRILVFDTEELVRQPPAGWSERQFACGEAEQQPQLDHQPSQPGWMSQPKPHEQHPGAQHHQDEQQRMQQLRQAHQLPQQLQQQQRQWTSLGNLLQRRLERCREIRGRSGGCLESQLRRREHAWEAPETRLEAGGGWPVAAQFECPDVGWAVVDVAVDPDLEWLVYSAWSPTVRMLSLRGLQEQRQLREERRELREDVGGLSGDPQLIDAGRDPPQAVPVELNGHQQGPNRGNQGRQHYGVSSGDDSDEEAYERAVHAGEAPLASFVIHPHGRRGRICVFSVRVGADRRSLLAGSSDGSVSLYDMEAERLVHQLPGAHGEDTNCVSWDPSNPQVFLSAGDDGLCKVWDRRILPAVAPGSAEHLCVGVFPGHDQGVCHVAARSSGLHYVTQGKDQAMKLWDIRRMVQYDPAMTRLVEHFDYRWQAYPAQALQFRLRNPNPGDRSLATYRGHTVLETLIRCQWSPRETTGERYLATGSKCGGVFVFDVLTGEVRRKLVGHRGTTRDISWHPTRPGLLLSSSWDGTVARWEARNHEVP